MPLDNDRSGPGLIDVLDRVLDKGIVIDAAVRVSLAGVELLSVDARVVVASIETYLRHADALAYTAMAAAPAKLVPDEPVLYVEPVDAALPPEVQPLALDVSATPAEAVTPAPEAESPLPEGQPPPLAEAQPPSLSEAQPPSLPEARAPSLPEAQPPSLPEAQAPSLSEAQPPSLPEAQPPSLPEAQAPSLSEAQEEPRDDG